MKNYQGIDECLCCGCTQNNACEGGCSWITPDLCSSCADLFKDEIALIDKLKKVKEETAIEIANALLDNFEINGSSLTRDQEDANRDLEEMYEWILETFTNLQTKKNP